jgi:hypothetical protein
MTVGTRFDDALNKAKEMNFSIQPLIVNEILDFAKDAQQSIRLKDDETDLLSALVLLKSCDSALTQQRCLVTHDDVKIAERRCAPGVVVTLRTSLLDNPDISSVRIYASDIAEMRNAGLETVFDLASTPPENAALALGRKIRESLPPNVPLSQAQADTLLSRMRIWREEASLIASHLNEKRFATA